MRGVLPNLLQDIEGNEVLFVAGKLGNSVSDLIWDDFILQTEMHEWIGVKYAES